MASIRKNILYSSILTISGYLFPMLTFPYVTRVLGVENIGIYNYVDGIISYFCIFAMLGINTVGIREISKVKNDQEKLSKVFSSLFIMNMATTLISILLLLLLVPYIPKLENRSVMVYIGVGRILFNSLVIEWLFRGLENFKYITNRSIAIRVIYVVSVFVFVKAKDDYVIFYLLTVLTFFANALLNIIYSRKFVSLTLRGLSFRPYLIPILTLGVYSILTSIYTSFNVTYLGIVSGDAEVGYYSTAIKLYAFIISFFSAFSGVMLPRLSSIVEQRDFVEFRRLTDKSVDALLAFAMPFIVMALLYAPQIVRLIAGPGYEGAIIPMRIVMPLMLLIGYEQIIIIQMLSPLRKDKAILINSLVGAAVAIILNLYLVPKYASVGSSCVWVMSEIAVTISAQCFVYKYIGYKMPYIKFSKRIFSAIPIAIVCLAFTETEDTSFISFVIGSALIFAYYLILECFVLKNDLVTSSINIIKEKCTRLFLSL